MGRKILAIVAGFVVWTIIWLGGNAVVQTAAADAIGEDGSVTSAGVLLLLLVISIVCSAAGGFVTAKVATEGAAKIVLTLGIVLLVVGIAVQVFAAWDLMPVWYHLIFLVLLVPMAIAGGRMAGAR